MQWSRNMIHSHFTLCLRACDYIKRLFQHPGYGLWMRVKGPHHYKVVALGSCVKWPWVTNTRSIFPCNLSREGMLALGVGWGWRILIKSSSYESDNSIWRWCNFCVGCMTSHSVSYMCKIEEKMTQALYLRILQDGVMKRIEWYHFNPSHVSFQYDDDPKHTTKLANRWLSIQNFHALTWPPQSPDLNSIEHVWALATRKLNEYPTPSKGMFQLWDCVQASFHSIIHEQCQRFYHNMPNCIRVVLASKGRWTNYWS